MNCNERLMNDATSHSAEKNVIVWREKSYAKVQSTVKVKKCSSNNNNNSCRRRKFNIENDISRILLMKMIRWFHYKVVLTFFLIINLSIYHGIAAEQILRVDPLGKFELGS